MIQTYIISKAFNTFLDSIERCKHCGAFKKNSAIQKQQQKTNQNRFAFLALYMNVENVKAPRSAVNWVVGCDNFSAASLKYTKLKFTHWLKLSNKRRRCVDGRGWLSLWQLSESAVALFQTRHSTAICLTASGQISVQHTAAASISVHRIVIKQSWLLIGQHMLKYTI